MLSESCAYVSLFTCNFSAADPVFFVIGQIAPLELRCSTFNCKESTLRRKQALAWDALNIALQVIKCDDKCCHS